MAVEAKSQVELESSIYVGAIATAIVYQQATKPFTWYTIIFQVFGGLILSGIFGSLFGCSA